MTLTTFEERWNKKYWKLAISLKLQFKKNLVDESQKLTKEFFCVNITLCHVFMISLNISLKILKKEYYNCDRQVSLWIFKS